MKIVHCLSGLDVGGAEIAMARLVEASRDHDQLVVSVGADGPIGDRLRARGVRVRALGKRPGVPDPRAIVRLARLLRAERADVVQSWMYEANFYGLLAARLARVPRVAWNLRCSDTDWRFHPRGAAAAFRLNRLLSGHPDAIVVNSWAGRNYHASSGFEQRNMRVIPNGFDTEEFRPDERARRQLREELGLGEQPLVGMIGRWDPAKDHRTFAAAAVRILEAVPGTRFLLAGSDIGHDNPALVETLGPGLLGRCTLLGRREDMPRVMAALDLLTLSSAYGEGLPNVLGEAMAAGVPCVATDVGDAGRVVGNTGRITRRGDPDALARAAIDLLQMPAGERARLGAAARERVARSFSHDAVRRRYEHVYAQVAGRQDQVPCPA